MAKIFLSYRRQDSPAMAGRIYDRLRAHFGNDAVFMDIDSIPFGADFREHIDAAVGQCDLVLAVIGTKWAGETGAHRRLDNPKDFVRIELESALHRNLPVIPILIDHATMPSEMDLPPSLARLAFRNAIDVDQGRDFHPHVDRLIKGIEFHFERTKTAHASPSSQAREAAPSFPVAQEPERPQNVIIPTEAGKPPKPTPKVEPRPDNHPSTFDPGHEPKATPQGDAGLKPEARAMPAGMIESEPLPIQTEAAPVRKGSSVSRQLEDASPKRPNTTWLWLYVGALPLLAFLGVIMYIVNFQRGQESPLDIRKPPPTELAGNKKAASPRRSGAGKSKPASATTEVQAPQPSPPQPRRDWTNSIGIKLVSIEAGEFLMGTTKDQVDQLMRLFPDTTQKSFDKEQPAHSVRLSKPFYLGIHEVTQGQYQAVMGENPSHFKGSDDLPVENVSGLDAVKFCNKLSEREKRTPFYRIDGSEVTLVGGNGYRLPTEAEWEYACRAKSTTLYPFGDDASKLGEHAWSADNSQSKSHPVGQKLPNAWGLYDMLGNVWEQCADWYDEKYYAPSPLADTPGAPRATPRVCGGGSWLNDPWLCRPARRIRGRTESRGSSIGFRVAAVQE